MSIDDEFNTLCIAGLLLVIAISIGMIITFFAIPSYLTCHSKASKQGLECEWGILQGCMVKMPSGNWIDYDRLRYMNEETK